MPTISNTIPRLLLAAAIALSTTAPALALVVRVNEFAIVGEKGNNRAEWIQKERGKDAMLLHIQSFAPFGKQGDFAGLLESLGADDMDKAQWRDFDPSLRELSFEISFTDQLHKHVRPEVRFEIVRRLGAGQEISKPQYYTLGWKHIHKTQTGERYKLTIDVKNMLNDIAKSEGHKADEYAINRFVIGGRELQRLGPNHFMDCKIDNIKLQSPTSIYHHNLHTDARKMNASSKDVPLLNGLDGTE